MSEEVFDPLMNPGNSQDDITVPVVEPETKAPAKKKKKKRVVKKKVSKKPEEKKTEEPSKPVKKQNPFGFGLSLTADLDEQVNADDLIRKTEIEEDDLFSMTSSNTKDEDSLFSTSSSLFGDDSDTKSTPSVTSTNLFEADETDDIPNENEVGDLFIPKTAETTGPALFKERTTTEIEESKDDLAFLEDEVDLDKMKKKETPKPKPQTQTTIAFEHKETGTTVGKVDDDLFSLFGSDSSTSTGSGLTLDSIGAYISQNSVDDDKGLFD